MLKTDVKRTRDSFDQCAAVRLLSSQPKQLVRRRALTSIPLVRRRRDRAKKKSPWSTSVRTSDGARRSASTGRTTANAPLPDECEQIVKKWGDAFRACGFCQVLGHGVPDDVVAKARELGRDFFEATTDAEREACAGDGGRGYKGVGAVAVAASGVTADGASRSRGRPTTRRNLYF